MSTNDRSSIRRRTFLGSTAASLAAAAGLRAASVAAGQEAVARAAGRPAGRVVGANERIRVGLIGCGSLGWDFHIPKLIDLAQDKAVNIQIAGVCDIYEPRKLRAKEATKAELYHDYRKMLERHDIDAVVIATPDHWHSRMAIDAMESGKDVHVEKPMTLYWEEARDLYRTAKRLARVVQVGAEGTSKDMFWQARKLIAAGALGKLVWVSGGVYRNEPGGDWNWPMDSNCSPQNLDWDAFLGPAAKRAFEPERYFRYRKYWDYSGGVAHDLIAHVLSAVQICTGPEFPSRVSAAGGIYVHHDRETPDTFSMQVEYPSGYLATLFCTQTTEAGDKLTIRGHKASIQFSGPKEPGKVIVTPERAYDKEAKEYTIPEQPRIDHDRNFFQCIRTREEPHCSALTGYKVMVALALAVRSYREGRMFTFDPVKEEIVG